jgi:ubiquinone/menaquinone biosynthesis C-methylase UbiE
MDERLQLRIQRYGWDAAVDYYQDGWQASLEPAQNTLIKMSDLKPGLEVVETACGSGLVTSMLSKAVGPNGAILATDISERMADATSALGLENVRAARMEAEHLDAKDQSFDRTICALGLMYSANPTQAVAEMHRVLRPGGRAAATVWGERRLCGWASVFPIVDARVASEVCPMFFATGVPGGLVREFENAGFEEIEEHRQFETLEYDSAETLLNAVLMGGAVALAIKRFDQSTLDEVNEEFLASVSDCLVEGRYKIPGEFVTVTGIRTV